MNGRRTEFTVGGATSGLLVVSGAIRKQAEQAMRSISVRQGSSVASALVHALSSSLSLLEDGL